MTKWKKFESTILSVFSVVLMVNLAKWLFLQDFIAMDWKIPIVFFCGSMSVFILIIVDAIYEKHFKKGDS